MLLINRIFFIVASMLALCVSTLHAEGLKQELAGGTMAVMSVKSFMYQLQNIENDADVEKLAASHYDMLVVEPVGINKDHPDFDMKKLVARLRAGKPDRLVIAYLDACQAESYRSYWGNDWRAPTKTAKGTPDFILAADPDGWVDNYNVAFWDARWQLIMVTGKDSLVHRLMRAGFDGVYIDWVDAWSEDGVVAEAKRQKVDAAREMVKFLALIRKEARSINPNAIVIQQNAITLIDAEPRLAEAIDAVGVEDTWFGGKPNAKWSSKAGGDRPNKDRGEMSTENRLTQYKKYLALGKPVFTIDYCLSEKNAQRVYAEAGRNGLVPLVTRISLEHMTTTPPPAIVGK